MRRFFAIALCACLLFAVLPTTARADMGPKPSVVVSFVGLENETYYATLLSKSKSTGPNSAVTPEEAANYQGNSPEEQTAYQKFAAYQDPDGYYFLDFIQDCSGSNQLRWGYFPPSEFKILLYFPAQDSLAVSRSAHSTYAFDSYYTADLSDLSQGGTFSAERSYDHTGELLNLLARIVLTIALELLLALPFGYRAKKQLLLIGGVNLTTQVGLNVALNIIRFQHGPWAFLGYYILLELLVFVAEAVVYGLCLRRLGDKPAPSWKAVAYALVANVASFVAGLCLAAAMPGIF